MDADVLEQAQQAAKAVLANVTADQLDLSTPCEGWKVAQLIDHMVGTQHWAHTAITGAESGPTGEGASGGDFHAAFDEAAAQNVAAFREDGALERTVNPGFGDMPGAALLGIAATDTFTHAWDLATATGQDNDLDPALAARLLERARQTIPPAFRTEDGSIFKPEQPAPEGANNATRLAAFLGRTV
ncbi:MAG: TIGR03086 family protein [Acidimicrobiales bacterium]|nr:TIGR03086 family protein [Acidimicrobiales bacterium]